MSEEKKTPLSGRLEELVAEDLEKLSHAQLRQLCQKLHSIIFDAEDALRGMTPEEQEPVLKLIEATKGHLAKAMKLLEGRDFSNGFRRPEIKAMHDFYIRERHIADSIYGQVWLGNVQGVKVALKFSDVERIHARSSSMQEDPMAELEVFKAVARAGGHPYIVNLLDEKEEFTVLNPESKKFEERQSRRYHWTVMEWCDGGEFFNRVAQTGALDDTEARRLFRQLISGVEFLHSLHIAHLDLSLENMMVDAKGDIKITDFGMSRKVGKDLFHVPHARPGKLGYMAPCIYENKPFDGYQSDMYSIGIILFVMVAGFPPYQAPSRQDPRFNFIYGGKLAELLTKWGLKLDPNLIQLMQGLLSKPDARWTLEQVKKSEWFNKKP